MRIGVDLTGLDPSYLGGVTTFALGLVSGLAEAARGEYSVVLISNRQSRPELERIFGSKVGYVVVEPGRWDAISCGAIRYVSYLSGWYTLRRSYDRLAMRRQKKIIEASVDAVIVPTTLLNIHSLEIPVVLCIHDIQHEYFPEYFSLRTHIARWSTYRVSSSAATYVQVSSIFIKECLLEKFKFLDPRKIFVSFEGVDVAKFTSAPSRCPPEIAGSAEPFVFYPAQLWPHKNHMTLLDALEAFRNKHGRELCCILTGQDFGMRDALVAGIKARGLQRVLILGKVPFEQLIYLYTNCAAVLSLGLHESSSLVLREGAVFGKPIVCSDIAPNLEVQALLNVVTFESRNALDLFSKLELVASALPSLLAAAAENKQRVKALAWDRVAQDYVDVIRTILVR